MSRCRRCSHHPILASNDQSKPPSWDKFLYSDTEGEESKNHTVASHRGALQVFWLNWFHTDFCTDLRHYFNKILTKILYKSDLSGVKLNVGIA